MQVYVGDTRSRALVAACRELGWGRMFGESHATPEEGEPWGFDNGAFGAWLRGQAFPADRFERRLARCVEKGLTPTVAVVPDLVAQGQASLEFSLGWLARLPTTWPWYLAVQDGMTPEDIGQEIYNFHGIFLGGTTRFKSQAHLWCRFARLHHKRFHYARAGTPTRIQHAVAVEADSLDSSFPLWTNERFRDFVKQMTDPDSPLLPTIHAWLGGIYDADPLTGCAP